MNENGIPDGCEPDCNANETPDDIDMAECAQDCGNGIDPELFNCCDCNANGFPDGCEPDCNQNGVPDDCDMDIGDPDGDTKVSADCNGNGVPDECEADCDGNGVPDDCDVDPLDPDGDEWVDPDCNGNLFPDSCDIDIGPPIGSLDCNENGIPDECDNLNCDPEEDPSLCDCNENGYPDRCDIGAEISEDLDENGVPDECEEESMMMMSGEGEGFLSDGDDAEAWAELYQWCLEQNWGPDSQYTGLEQLERFAAKRRERGL